MVMVVVMVVVVVVVQVNVALVCFQALCSPVLGLLALRFVDKVLSR